jgi:CBS domain-containing protein
MRVATLMTRSVVVCRPDERLADVADRMWMHDVGWMPVVDVTGRVVGVITERDTCGCDGPSAPPLVASILGGEPPCCRPSDSLGHVASLMRERRVLRLPVVDDDGKLLGLLAFDDLALELPMGGAGFRSA